MTDFKTFIGKAATGTPLSADDAAQAFDIMMHGESGKVILEWTHEEAGIIDDEYFEEQTA